jgi:predicted TIM-barrel fold metal-dependent hydrolase
MSTTMNDWRLPTPGTEGWARTARAGDPNKYFVVSADCHTTESLDFLQGVDPKYKDRVPRTETRADGSQVLITEGRRPRHTVSQTVRRAANERPDHNRDPRSRMEEEDHLRTAAGRTIEQRVVDQAADGVDVEVLFPTTGLMCWATPDSVFAMNMCAAWNRWAKDHIGPLMQGPSPKIVPMALICGGDQEGAQREIEWAANNGFRGICLGNSPVYGRDQEGKLQYNDPTFEPMWSLIEETGLVVTFHVSTGRDPRGVGGNGGAIINYVCHAVETTIEPMVQMVTSGVFERHPGIRAGAVESGIGFVPWMMEAMDHAYRAHHFWVRPVIPELPSEYFRRNCFATFQQDEAGLRFAEEFNLVPNLLWGNDYPHHEGTWPHSAESIERTMGHLSEDSRAAILGLNAARIFGVDVPA